MLITDIIQSFKQGKRGNCVSIAVIKSAMHLYGIDNIFISKETNAQGNIEIEMRDGYKTVVRKHELVKGSKYSRFNKGNNEDIREMAFLYYTAMAKRVLTEGEIDAFLGRQTLRGALRSLHNGENYMEGIKWLGLVNNFEEIPIEEIKSHENLIGASNAHCYFISNGIVDNYGNPFDIDALNNNNAFSTRNLVKLTL